MLFVAKMGNCAVYILRHLIKKVRSPELISIALCEIGTEQTTGQCLLQPQLNDKAKFKGFSEALKKYKKNPERFSGKPELPDYRNRYRTFCVGRNGYKIENHWLIITGAETFDFKPVVFT